MDSKAHNNSFDPQGIFRIKGVGKLNPRQLGMLMALYTWRDQVAQEANLPPGRIIHNEGLLMLAKVSPTNFGGLRRIRLHARTLKRYGDHIINCIKEHRHNPPTPPEPPARRQPEPIEKSREQALKNWRRKEAERRNVPLQVVLPARSLDFIKKNGSDNLQDVPLLGNKRLQQYGEAIAKIVKEARKILAIKALCRRCTAH